MRRREPEAPLVGGEEILPARLRQRAQRDLHAGESVELVLVGQATQALVVLERRLLVVKAGLEAGLPLAAKAMSFDFRDVVDLDLQEGPVLSIVWISSTSYAPDERAWWQARDSTRDPFRAPNALPVATEKLELYRPHLEWLRQAVADERDDVPAESALVTSLERLAALRASGALSEEEFERAKAQLLRA